MSNSNSSTMDDLTAKLHQSQISDPNNAQGPWNTGPPSLRHNSKHAYGQFHTQPFNQSLPTDQGATGTSGPQATRPAVGNDYHHSPRGRNNYGRGFANYSSYIPRQSTFPPTRNASLMDFVRGGPISTLGESMKPPSGQNSPADQISQYANQAEEIAQPCQETRTLARQQTFPADGSNFASQLPTRTRNQMLRAGEHVDDDQSSFFQSSPFHQYRPWRTRPPDFEIFASQCQYLDELVALEVPLVAITNDELMEKEKFRQHLQEICRNAIIAVFPNDSQDIDLVPYGSIQSGFATKSSDIDLIFLWKNGPSMKTGEMLQIVTEVLETAILNSGCGARLISKTRVPVMKVCQFPSDELRHALISEKQKTEEEKAEERLCETNSGVDSSNIDLPKGKFAPNEDGRGEEDPANSRPSSSYTRESIGEVGATQIENRQKKWYRERPLGSLDFPETGVGIQCDVGFTKFLGIYNTQLLRCYSACDTRVKDMVLFVKSWAKKRKINSSYSGTLSSYGWALMVLHYLINIATPPVLPNLQVDMPIGAERRTFEGYDVGFFDNIEKLAQAAQLGQLTRNADPIGSLLRGFFQYYGQQGSQVIGRGFMWKSDIISIRTRGGLLLKSSKGWTAATTINQNGIEVRQRYLLAIECPMETDHNVARTVHHNGIVAIRDEFRRAWRILDSLSWRRQQRPEGLLDELIENHSVDEAPGFFV